MKKAIEKHLQKLEKSLQINSDGKMIVSYGMHFLPIQCKSPDVIDLSDEFHYTINVVSWRYCHESGACFPGSEANCINCRFLKNPSEFVWSDYKQFMADVLSDTGCCMAVHRVNAALAIQNQ